MTFDLWWESEMMPRFRKNCEHDPTCLAMVVKIHRPCYIACWNTALEAASRMDDGPRFIKDLLVVENS